MTLCETFSQPLAWSWFDHRHISALFEADSVRYVARFSPTEDDHWDFDFSARTPAEKLKFDRTGTGNPFLVFATIIQIIEAFITEKHPAVIHFFAPDEAKRRDDLYGHMLQRMTPALAQLGYTSRRQDHADSWEAKVSYEIIRSE